MESYNHDSGSFSGKGGVDIFFQKWIADKAKAVLIVVHGLGEHSGRYENLLKALSGKNISVLAVDHRGHGKSEGKRGHIDSFMDYVYDLKLFIEFAKEEYKGLPVTLYGHSMGGVIAAKYALTYPGDLKSLVLSSPGLAPAFTVPGWKKGLASFFSSRVPSLTMPNGISASQISHDSEAVRAYENDPLNHDRVSARWFSEFINAGQECLASAESVTLPLLVFHGKGDTIADWGASEEFFNKAGSKDKELLLYEGLFHEAINESPEKREPVLADVAGWIMKHIGSAKKAAAKKGTAKKSAAKKGAPKKAASKKSAAKKASAKKTATKKSASKKSAGKKAPAKKAAAKKSTVKKTAAKKTSSKKTSAKKTSKKTPKK